MAIRTGRRRQRRLGGGAVERGQQTVRLPTRPRCQAAPAHHQGHRQGARPGRKIRLAAYPGAMKISPGARQQDAEAAASSSRIEFFKAETRPVGKESGAQSGKRES